VVIDDITKREKNKDVLRFLMIGDFLFSLTSFDIKDPSELIFKTTRDQYIKRIRLRADINIMFGCD
jgi:hypothetical protein